MAYIYSNHNFLDIFFPKDTQKKDNFQELYNVPVQLEIIRPENVLFYHLVLLLHYLPHIRISRSTIGRLFHDSLYFVIFYIFNSNLELMLSTNLILFRSSNRIFNHVEDSFLHQLNSLISYLRRRAALISNKCMKFPIIERETRLSLGIAGELMVENRAKLRKYLN